MVFLYLYYDINYSLSCIIVFCIRVCLHQIVFVTFEETDSAVHNLAVLLFSGLNRARRWGQ